MINILEKAILFTLPFFLFISCTNLNTDADIYGGWSSNFNNHEFVVVFKNDKTCMLRYFNKESNKFETISGNYELDFSKKPIPLSIRNIPELNHPLHTIIKFVNDDSILMAEFSSKWRLRPISFEIGKTIKLSRIPSKK